jgi:hypothetical protein
MQSARANVVSAALCAGKFVFIAFFSTVALLLT